MQVIDQIIAIHTYLWIKFLHNAICTIRKIWLIVNEIIANPISLSIIEGKLSKYLQFNELLVRFGLDRIPGRP